MLHYQYTIVGSLAVSVCPFKFLNRLGALSHLLLFVVDPFYFWKLRSVYFLPSSENGMFGRPLKPSSPMLECFDDIAIRNTFASKERRFCRLEMILFFILAFSMVNSGGNLKSLLPAKLAIIQRK